MDYHDVFILFWKQVKESAAKNEFAKLTLAKTIGKPNLRNIFLRPVYGENRFTVLLKLRYRSLETEDTENEYSLEEAFEVLKPYLKTSFSSVLLFTTTKDVMMKINKKGLGSITEQPPSFKEVPDIDSER